MSTPLVYTYSNNPPIEKGIGISKGRKRIDFFAHYIFCFIIINLYLFLIPKIFELHPSYHYAAPACVPADTQYPGQWAKKPVLPIHVPCDRRAKKTSRSCTSLQPRGTSSIHYPAWGAPSPEKLSEATELHAKQNTHVCSSLVVPPPAPALMVTKALFARFLEYAIHCAFIKKFP